MMKKILYAGILAFIPFLSQAQYLGPKSEHKVNTVAELLTQSKDLAKAKTTIKTVGFVIEKLEPKDLYVFQDATGKMNAEISPDDLPPVPFDDKDEVLLIGDMKVLKGVPTLIVSKTILVKP